MKIQTAILYDASDAEDIRLAIVHLQRLYEEVASAQSVHFGFVDRDTKKIDAIKLVRAVMNIGLKEAKDVMDACLFHKQKFPLPINSHQFDQLAADFPKYGYAMWRE